jgi:hypothetical protein
VLAGLGGLVPRPAAADTDDANQVGDAAAMVVLGTSLDDLQAPATGADLAASVGGAFEGGELPTSYAIEISPYWLSGAGRKLSLRDYAGGGGWSLVRNLHVSVATTHSTSDGLRAALAARTTLWGPPGPKTNAGKFVAAYDALGKGAPPGDGDACVRTLSDLAMFADVLSARLAKEFDARSSAADGKAAELIAACAAVDPVRLPKSAATCAEQPFRVATPAPNATLDRDADTTTNTHLQALAAELADLEQLAETGVNTYVKAAIADIKAHPEKLDAPLRAYLAEHDLTDTFDGCEDLLTHREGFALDIAGGASLASEDNVLSETEGDDAALWVTPAWTWGHTSLLFLGRASFEDMVEDPAFVLDLGVGTGHQWDRFTGTIETLARLPIADADFAARVKLGLDLRVSSGVWFSTSFGVSYPFDAVDSILANAGFTFGVAQERTLATPSPSSMAGML